MAEFDKEFETLPVEDFKDEILAAIETNQVIICIGETGSGKTTKIPQFCADATFSGFDGSIRVAVTQPRRVAAVTVAERVASERQCDVGSEVGYTIRFDDRSHPDKTRIKFMTDGVLVRECLSDPSLERYGVVMLDEAHERSIHTDILFALLKSACSTRSDLKLIVTSATLNAQKFSAYFNNCPIIRIPGRVYPVDLYHSKNKHVVSASGPTSKGYIMAAIDLAEKIHFEQEPGHILIFLTGQDDIEETCSELRRRMTAAAASSSSGHRARPDDLLVLPLYSSMPSEQQQRVFRRYPSEIRKCVVATNIAETSITVPNTRYVIDPGFVKQKAYDPTRRMEALVTVPISQVAAQQRAGRAGRTAPGACYRLYSSDCYENFMGETIPEIMRSSLSNVILYLKVLGIHDVLDFDFLDRPSEDQIEEALVNLHVLGALDDSGAVTSVGKSMSQFSVEPNLAKMLVDAIDNSSADQQDDNLGHVAIICAMLSVEDIWWADFRSGGNKEGNSQRRALIDEAHSRLRDPWGDHLTYLNVFLKYIHEGRESKSWCEDNYIKYRALRTAKKICQQLIVDASKIKSTLPREIPSHLSSRSRKIILHSIASGFFMNAGRRCGNENLYRSLPMREQSVAMYHVHPTSALHDNTTEAEYVIFVELSSSSKVFMKHICAMPRDLIQKFRVNYKFISAKKLCGKPDPLPEVHSGATAGQQRQQHSTTMPHSSASAVIANSANDSAKNAELARQRYLERKRKLGGS